MHFAVGCACMLFGVKCEYSRLRGHSRSIRSPLKKYEGALTDDNLDLLWWLMCGVFLVFALTLMLLFCCMKWGAIRRYAEKFVRKSEKSPPVTEV